MIYALYEPELMAYSRDIELLKKTAQDYETKYMSGELIEWGEVFALKGTVSGKETYTILPIRLLEDYNE
jgi:hypothetical protein